MKYTLTYKTKEKGSLHYSITDANDNLDWTIEKTYFQFDNLFNGNKAMGKPVIEVDDFVLNLKLCFCFR